MALITSAKPRSEGIAGLILAGGLARRMGGGDKGLVTLGGRPMLERAVERLKPQAALLALSANGDPQRFAALNLPVLADPIEGHPGPLAGVLAGLIWARDHGLTWLVSAACDTPFFPRDLVARLAAASTGQDIVCAASGERRHPVFALWSALLAKDLRRMLTEGSGTSVEQFMSRHRIGVVEWLDRPYDPFFNVNRPAELADAERIIAEIDP